MNPDVKRAARVAPEAARETATGDVDHTSPQLACQPSKAFQEASKQIAWLVFQVVQIARVSKQITWLRELRAAGITYPPPADPTMRKRLGRLLADIETIEFEANGLPSGDRRLLRLQVRVALVLLDVAQLVRERCEQEDASPANEYH